MIPWALGWWRKGPTKVGCCLTCESRGVVFQAHKTIQVKVVSPRKQPEASPEPEPEDEQIHHGYALTPGEWSLFTTPEKSAMLSSAGTLRPRSHRTRQQICTNLLRTNPLMIASCVNTPIDHNVFHYLRTRVTRCSASCVNGAQAMLQSS